jgi:hypothetical protein
MDTGETAGPTPEKRRGPPLKTMKHLRVFVAKTLRALKAEGDPGDPNCARCLIYGAKVLSEIIASTDIEERLSRLEGRRHEQGAVQ